MLSATRLSSSFGRCSVMPPHCQKRAAPVTTVEEEPPREANDKDFYADVSQDGQTTDGTEDERSMGIDLGIMEHQLRALLANRDLLAQVQKSWNLCSLIAEMEKTMERDLGHKETVEEVLIQGTPVVTPVTLESSNKWNTGSTKIRQSGTELHFC